MGNVVSFNKEDEVDVEALLTKLKNVYEELVSGIEDGSIDGIVVIMQRPNGRHNDYETELIGSMNMSGFNLELDLLKLDILDSILSPELD